ncbi:MAG: AmmeMemoRadiSam system protein B [Candidatus Omnitrophota bacterium]|jgi:AmmeMemoRadiSam system protein B|nr:MAG: AmmeMemoRadiSam system protein B [Candidatus Omnitrophota bacterium]
MKTTRNSLCETMNDHDSASSDILQPSVAGQFYPSDPNQLAADIRRYLAEAEIRPSEKTVLAIMVPHAGYVFSAPVAAYSFKHVQNQPVDTVLFLAICHQGVEGGCVFAGQYYKTPLGTIPVDAELVSALLQNGEPLYASTSPYRYEHSVEVNLPFVQILFPQAKAASILITHTKPQLCKQIGMIVADTIRAHTDRSILICVSTDMSHYPSYEEANRIDQAALRSLESLDPTAIYAEIRKLEQEPVDNLHCVLCGSAAMLTAIEAAHALGATEAKTLCYRNSGDSAYGDHLRVVGYGALAVYASSSQKQLA